jgi:predicted PurR-regulated permease PerM
MTIVDSRTTRVLFTALLFALGIGFVYAARRTLILFLFAIIFAYLINPAVGRLEKLVRSRVWAIAIIYLMLLIGLAIVGFLVGPRIARQGARLGESLPGLVDKASTGQLSGQIRQLAAKIGSQHHWSDDTQRRIQSFLLSRREDLARLAQHIGVRAAEAVQQVWVLFLVPILAVFFLRDGGTFQETLLSLVQSRTQREFLDDVLQDLNQMLAQFIRAQLTLAALSLVAYLTFLSVMRVPYALMLGAAGGALEFLPVAGPLIGGVAMMAVAILTGSHWGFLLLFLFLWRMLQDYVISPRIMGSSVELHPLAALFGILAGGEIAGVLGVYLSIPVMASLRIVWRRWRIFVEKRRFGPLNEYSFPQDLGKGKTS